MKRIILAALVGLLVSGPAWAGSREIEDCETLIKMKLKFPGSYRREQVATASQMDELETQEDWSSPCELVPPYS